MKLQNEDFKSESDLTGSGGSVSQLLNDTKIYVTAGAINKKLSSAIEDGDIGGGGGGINYIDNGRAASATTGWATYADAAGSLPVDGTGGTPNVTWTRSTTTPLRDAADFNFVKDAANRQGQGVSYDFTIDRADQAKVMTISADYEIVSGTFASGDLTVYIYDVTNAQVIQPAGFSISNIVGQSKVLATFQSASNSTSYRLIIHVATTSASAYTLAFDNISVGPAAITQGTPVTDWVSYTPTLTNFTASATSFFWRRVGDTLQFKGKATVSGVTGAMQVSMPSGFSVDTSKISAANLITGICLAEDVGVGFHSGVTEYQGNSVGFLDDDAGSRYASTIPMTWASGDFLSFEASFPIVGWSSTVQMSSDTDTRIVSLIANSTNAQSIPNATSTTVTTWTVQQDTHGAFNATTGVYTVQVPGVYQISGFIAFNANGTGNRELIAVHTGSSKTLDREAANGTDGNYSTGTATFNCIAGDTLRLNVSQNSGGSLSLQGAAQYQYIQINRLSGPSQIASTESVNARYTTAAGQSITNGSTTILDFGTKVWDSHNAVTTGASWKFTAPVAGKYRVAFNVLMAAPYGTVQVNLYKNGSTFSELYRNLTSNQNMWFGTDLVNLLAGDTVDVRLINNHGSTVSLNANADECRVRGLCNCEDAPLRVLQKVRRVGRSS